MRVRHSQPTDNVTAATVDSGKNTPQTAVTFRCADWGADIMVTYRPDPRAKRAADSSERRTLA